MAPSIEPSPAAPSVTSEPIAPIAMSETWVQLDQDHHFAALAGPVLAMACRATAAPAGVIFRYVQETDALAPAVARGLEAPVLASLHMRLGERLGGWVAASRRGQRDADARLDLLTDDTTLRAAISIPIVRDDALVGVMTLYAGDPGVFHAGALRYRRRARIDDSARTNAAQSAARVGDDQNTGVNRFSDRSGDR